MSRTADPRIEFLLNFIEDPLPIRPSRWPRLREQLERFCLGGEQRIDRGALAGILLGPRPTEAEIRALRDDVRTLVTGFVTTDAARAAARSPGDARPTVTVQGLGLTLAGAPGTSSRRVFLLITSPRLQDLVLTIAAIVLGREPVPTIGSCADPSCGRLFAKIGKKQFCSPGHQMRVLMRTRRAAVRGAASTRRRRSRRRRAVQPPKTRRAR
jgi:hypothetical protein